MKKCKNCQKEIDNKAKKCPHCQSDLRNWFIRHKILTGIGIFIILIFVAALGSDTSTPTSTSDSSSSDTQEKVQTYQIGEIIKTEKFEITLVSSEERNQVGGQYFNEKASEGATLVTINWKYKNTTDKPISSFNFPSTKLIDGNGTEYSSDGGKSSSYATELDLDRKILSDLNPGITVNDAEVFEVSVETYAEEGWMIRFKESGISYFVEL